MSAGQSASTALEVEEREVSQSGQSEVGSQGFVVRQLPHSSALNWALKNTRIRKGQFCWVTYHAYVRWKVMFAYPRVQQARCCHHRRLAIFPSRHPGPCLFFSPRDIRTGVPMANVKTLRTVRLNTHRSGHPCTDLTAAARAS